MRTLNGMITDLQVFGHDHNGPNQHRFYAYKYPKSRLMCKMGDHDHHFRRQQARNIARSHGKPWSRKTPSLTAFRLLPYQVTSTIVCDVAEEFVSSGITMSADCTVLGRSLGPHGYRALHCMLLTMPLEINRGHQTLVAKSRRGQVRVRVHEDYSRFNKWNELPARTDTSFRLARPSFLLTRSLRLEL